MSTDDRPAGEGRRGFATTRWSLVLPAGESGQRLRESIRLSREPASEKGPQHPLTGAGARRGSALDRGREQLRQEWIVFGKPVRFVSEARPFDDTNNATHHAAQGSFQFLIGWWRGGVKPQGPIIL